MPAQKKIAACVANAMETQQPFYSVEFFPPKNPNDLSKFFAEVEKLQQLEPLFASVTYGAGGTTSGTTLNITRQLATMGITPMAHLTCVGATPDSITSYLKELEAANVTSILALRGDAPKETPDYDWSKGEFRHASDLVGFINEHFPHFDIGVAAYPSPHPESPTFSADREAAAFKLSQSDLAITQLFFDSREYENYMSSLKRRNINKPVIPGIMPIQSFESLRRIMMLSGGNIPSQLYLALEEANDKGGKEAVRAKGIEFAAQQIKTLVQEYGAPGIHLYTLNKASLCLELVEAVKAL